jgi:hypothetical protein
MENETAFDKRRYEYETGITQRKTNEFLDYCYAVSEDLVKYHATGFKGWILKDGKVEPIFHDWYKQLIAQRNEAIEARKKALGLD